MRLATVFKPRNPARFALIVLGLFSIDAYSERLSERLLQLQQQNAVFFAGTRWETPEEKIRQAQLKVRLLALLKNDASDEAQALGAWIATLPVTGRIPLTNADPFWLLAHPENDPVLSTGDQVITTPQPTDVVVIKNDGQKCRVPLVNAAHAVDYLKKCGITAVDWAYVAQPDGMTSTVGVSTWNASLQQDSPAPGAWIWAPARHSHWPTGFSPLFIEFIATQGPAPARSQPSAAAPSTVQTPNKVPDVLAHLYPEGKALSNDWGNVGLLQTPSARMKPQGDFSLSITHVYPYTRDNVFLQPFPWLEVGFRYSDINNRLYGPVYLSGHQTYKDKSADVKIHLTDESFYLPELAVGIRDVAGTGLFSSEFVVASKRSGPLDFSAGLAWGYLGSRGNIRNPLGLIKSSFDQRPVNNFGVGGSFPLHTYFHGPSALFGGVQYQTPWDPLLLKLEYDGNNYQQEPLGIIIHPAIPWNFGLTYQATDYFDISAGLERGNTAEIAGTLHTDLSHQSMPKLDDPRPVAIAVHQDLPGHTTDWPRLAQAIHEQTNWDITRLQQHGHTLLVVVDHCTVTYWNAYLDRAMAVINHEAPEQITRVEFHYMESGLSIAEHHVDRHTWVVQHTQLLPPTQVTAAVVATAPVTQTTASGAGNHQDNSQTVFDHQRPEFELRPGFNFDYFMGGPNGFILYELAPAANLRCNIAPEHWIQAQIQYDVLNNYDNFNYDAPSNLPRVRTNIRKYVETSRLNLTHLQYTHTGQLDDNQYYSFYGGYLESMFAGAGSEWLYRPFASPWAFGIDLNDVRQRAFAQNFQLQPYHVLTGHASFYWETGWHHVNATIKAGQYLAGDRGVTVDLGKTFPNGVSMGGYFTKTNVSAQQFGEGSFDKGIYVNIPFDALTTRSSDLIGHFLWEPLLRDGGALLSRQTPLYDITQARSDNTLTYAAAIDSHLTRPEDRRIDDPAHLYDPAPELLQNPLPTTTQFLATPGKFIVPLTAALYEQGFRNIQIEEDVAHRLSVRLDNHQLFRPSLAVGRAARTVLNYAPMDIRELSIAYNHQVTYNFYDLQQLQRYFAGQSTEDELRRSAGVLYYDESWRPGDPFWYFGDLDEPRTPGVFTGDLTGMHPFERGFRDLRGTWQALTQQNWTLPLLAGTGLIAGSTLLDQNANRFAQLHGKNPLLNSIKNIGSDLPWTASALVAGTALSTNNPELSRTTYASAEATVSTFIMTLAVKKAVGRARPQTNQGPHSFHWLNGSSGNNTDSFPSGHTIASWSALTPLAEEYDAPWLYGVAGITNAARVIGQKHWLSDTVASSVLGWSIGTLFWEGGQWQNKALHLSASPESISISWDLP